MAIRLTTITSADSLPYIKGESIFHSDELFRVFELTRGYRPIMIVAYDGENVIAQLMAVVRRSVRLFPPSIIKRCEVYGNGEYFDDTYNKEEIFSMFITRLTNDVGKRSFLIEFRNLENPLLGYDTFRKSGYFPVNWLRVYNSLHSKTPQERLSSSRKRQINRAIRCGVTIEIAQNREDIVSFSRLLKKAYSSKLRKHFPDVGFFIQLAEQDSGKGMAKIFLVKYKNRIIGGTLCLFSANTAYIWFSMGLRKSYAFQYPGVMAVWGVIEYAYQNHYSHLEFMDPGLPFKKYGYREFILRFGGKQASTRRWFRFRWNWLNALFSKIYV